MKRIRCKCTLWGTTAKCGSNLMNGKHKRAAAKRSAKAAKKENDA